MEPILRRDEAIKTIDALRSEGGLNDLDEELLAKVITYCEIGYNGFNDDRWSASRAKAAIPVWLATGDCPD